MIEKLMISNRKPISQQKKEKLCLFNLIYPKKKKLSSKLLELVVEDQMPLLTCSNKELLEWNTPLQIQTDRRWKPARFQPKLHWDLNLQMVEVQDQSRKSVDKHVLNQSIR